MTVTGGIYWESHGPAGAPPLILSSGLGGASGYWAPNVAALAERHRVIAYDHRGTGRSDRNLDGPLTVKRMADDVRALMDAIGIETATFIGHALGGHIGLHLALESPERLDRLVVINGWAKLDPHTARCFDTRLALLRDSGPRAYLHAQPLFLYPPQWISDHDDRLRDEEEAQIDEFAGTEMVQRRIAAVRHVNLVDRLSEIATRTLVLAADDDMLVPASCSERLAAGLPNAQLARLTTGGHVCNVTRADHFNTWLGAWLDPEDEE